MSRLQIDLVDMRTRPDKIKQDVVFNWILNCIDHFNKFCRAFRLKNKSAVDVPVKLRELFFVFGPPRLLHSDNGNEFVARVLTELKKLLPELCFIRGRPRHPQSQGCVERANGVLCDALGKWLTTNNTIHCLEELLPVNNIDDGDDLPTPVADMDGIVVDRTDDTVDLVDSDVISLVEKLTDDVVCNSIVVKNIFNPNNEHNINRNNLLDCLQDVDSLLKCSNTDYASSRSAVSEPYTQSAISILDEITSPSFLSWSGIDVIASQPITSSLDPDSSTTQASSGNSLPVSTNTNISVYSSSSSRHDLIRKTATNNYLNTANKKIKLHHVYLNNLTEKFDVNDCVGVQIHTIDRTNTDAKLLPCLILEKNRKNDDLVFKLVCQYGKLQSAFSVEILVDLKSACPQELKQLSVDELKDISFIEVCKLYVSGAVSGRACDCYCPCKKANVSCSTKCHSKRGACQNMGD
ncbi:unnamed protein product [Didymodactylos carnosus]|uniref:Integrase catalytic domain-containing protein n=1 Tax=Didymodactylos carnosus TaxID=1234261 RepID=A0A814RRB0_9BILA|nr:unnamed protein product [Didymodactylos carnosus]CAF3899091.1 unnamed protein product [Didymodactylos carnosus]